MMASDVAKTARVVGVVMTASPVAGVAMAASRLVGAALGAAAVAADPPVEEYGTFPRRIRSQIQMRIIPHPQ